MFHMREVSVLDARETSTENLVRAIEDIAVRKATIEQQTKLDRINPKWDEAMRTDMIALNNAALKVWDKSAEILRAELKLRLH